MRFFDLPQHSLPRTGIAVGFSLLEMLLVVVLMAFLILMTLDRLLPLRGHAERAQVLENEGAMQAALGLEVTQRVLQQGFNALPALEGSNPMALMKKPPPQYQGSAPHIDPEALPAGGWAFDTGRGVLIYRVRFPEYFIGDPTVPARIEWRITLLYADGMLTEPNNIQGVVLETLGTPRWHINDDVF